MMAMIQMIEMTVSFLDVCSSLTVYGRGQDVRVIL